MTKQEYKIISDALAELQENLMISIERSHQNVMSNLIAVIENKNDTN